jgi:outer membrane protein insertion porin family
MKGGDSSVDKLWILLCITLLCAVLAPSYSWAAVEGIEITSINVTGLERLDESVVLTGLTIKTGDVLIGNATKKLNDAEEALYNTGWFKEAPQLSLEGNDVGTILQVDVVENPVYTGTRIVGNTLFSTERLMQEVEGTVDLDGNRTGAQLVPGEVLNVRKMVAAIDGVLSVYQDAGYVGAVVGNYSYQHIGPEAGMVDIPISEGVVDEVIITGLEKTQESVVRSQITHIHPGSVLRRSDIERDLNQIYNTGLFDTVLPDLQPSLKPDHVRVVIEVEEAPTGQAGFGLGYSTVNGLQGSVSYRERNLFGRGKQIGTTITFSNSKPGFDITYQDPYAGGRSFWGVGLYSINNRIQRKPGTSYESEMSVDKQGANVFWGQKLNDFDSYQVSFGIADYEYDIIKGDPFIGTDPVERARLAAEGETRKLGMSYKHDTRDNIFDTKEGFYGSINGELAGFGGDFAFNKWTTEMREFYEAGPGVLGLRQRLGLATGDVPIYEEYSLGGVNSIRGVSEDLLIGTHSFLGNVEYRVPVSDMFTIVGFLDMGWAGDSYSSMDSATGAGIGARIKIRALGMGAVRLDYGWELSGEEGSNKRFHFFLGEMF